MCYYLTSKLATSNIFQLEHEFVLQWNEPENFGYYAVSGFAHPKLPVITSEKEFTYLSWGLIPAWVKDWDSAKKLRIQTLNAQSETVDSKPSFRTAVKQKHFCIIPVNGFFEWHTHTNGEKYPFFIYPKQDSLFLMSGLYETWRNPATQELIRSFTIVTTEANERMAWIHNSKKRMPLILSTADAKHWLDSDLDFDQKKELMRPYNADLMLDHTVSKLITSRKDNPNQAAVIQRHEYPELYNTLF
jgi:putative SOS response-associated peptidase YedK